MPQKIQPNKHPPIPVHKLRIGAALCALAIAITLISADMLGKHVTWRDTTPTTPTRPSQTAELAYGLAMGDTLGSMTHGHRMKVLSDIRASGFKQVRLTLDWSTVQPHDAHSFSWKKSDSLLQDIAAHKLRMIITLNRTPAWARSPGCQSTFCPPQSADTFAAFAGSAAKRYHSSPIDAWEIWNEQNITNFWKPQPSAAAYADLLKQSYPLLKQATPQVPVLVGGLAGNALDSNGTGYIDPRTFLSQLYATIGNDHFDGVAYHPYTGLRLPNADAPYNGWPKMDQTKPSLRSIMAEHGDTSKDIWITEFGLPTEGSGTAVASLTATKHVSGTTHVTTADQATVAAAALKDVTKTPWIKSFDWYTYQDNPLDSHSSGGTFGLVQADGQPKPALQVFKEFLHK